jgi:hypothetical protein
MAEIINCPSCQRKLQVPETLLGQDVQCPTCGATFVAALGRQHLPPPAPEYPPQSPHYYPPPSPQPAPYPPPAPPRGYDSDHGDYDDYDRDYYRGPSRRYRRRDLSPHRGGTVLALGILSLVTGCGIILGPIAWVMGNQDLEEMRVGRMDPEGEGITQAGRICGIIATVIISLAVFFVCLSLMLPAMLR